MKLIGITGGVGMGKSTAQSLLHQRGVRTVDTDLLARELVEPGQPALAEIVRRFGASMVDGSGRLQRDLLASRVFRDETARRELEAILHPRIQDRWSAEATRWRDEAVKVAAVIIPLLFETKAASHFDLTACVACTGPTQKRRLESRGWTAEQAADRIASQWPIELKMAAADVVVWTEGALDVHAAQWDRLLGAL